MKVTLFCMLMLGAVTAFSKSSVDSTKILLHQARKMADTKSSSYNPQHAFDIYNKLAQQGSGEAMNALGMLYSKGIGTTGNDQEAIKWFQKSADRNYPGAFYNMALLYKDGLGVQQNYLKAYEFYKKGALLKDPKCLYGQGYMLYKGLGCDQDYLKAIALFKKGAARRDEGSYYMLGLCYRNGYGTAINIDSAKFWLTRAAFRGDNRAKNELADGSPENADLKNVPDLQAQNAQARPVNFKSGFKQIVQHVEKSDIAGDYAGFTVKFDWSGKHIIGQAALKLHLERKDKNLSGTWQEETQEPVSLNATLTDSDVVFNNTVYEQNDHYHQVTKLPTAFKDSHLNLVKSKDTVYLSGTLRKFSTNFKEPQKPEFIMLIRTDPKLNTLSDTSLNYVAKLKTDSIHFVAYPNPFTSSLKLKYTLKKDMLVSLIISDLQTGQIVYRSEAKQLEAGEHDSPVAFNGRPGNYIVTLQYGNKVKSAIVFKQ